VRAADNGAIVTVANHGYEKFFPLGLDAPSGGPDFTAASADPASIRRSSGLDQGSLPLALFSGFISRSLSRATRPSAFEIEGGLRYGNVAAGFWASKRSLSEFNVPSSSVTNSASGPWRPSGPAT
jgi:hypothetical protein